MVMVRRGNRLRDVLSDDILQMGHLSARLEGSVNAVPGILPHLGRWKGCQTPASRPIEAALADIPAKKANPAKRLTGIMA